MFGPALSLLGSWLYFRLYLSGGVGQSDQISLWRPGHAQHRVGKLLLPHLSEGRHDEGWGRDEKGHNREIQLKTCEKRSAGILFPHCTSEQVNNVNSLSTFSSRINTYLVFFLNTINSFAMYFPRYKIYGSESVMAA